MRHCCRFGSGAARRSIVAGIGTATTHPNLVLCYHALSPSWEADLSTTPQRFEHQVRRLLARGYRAVTFTEAATAPHRSGMLAITFDDAYRSVFELGLPILARLGAPGTVFVPTDYIDAGAPMCWDGIDHWLGGPSERELIPMSWAEIRTLATSGWEIGSHTGSHPHLTQLADDRLGDELTRSKAACEAALAAPCRSIAYPYGDVDARVISAAVSAGYTTAGALPDRFDSRDPMDCPRVGIYHGDDRLRFGLKVLPAVNALRSSAAWTLMQRARHAATG